MTRKRDEILDHEADGIKEFDNDLPRWWLYSFYFTIVLGVLYLFNFHVLSTPLVGPASIQAEYEAEMAAAEVARPAVAETVPSGEPSGPVVALTALTGEEDLEEGQEIFESQTHPCAACHRPDLGGLVGPNLTDDQWLHGCSAGEVVQAIRTGFPLQGMLPYGGGPALSDHEVLQVASYILASRGSNPPGAKAADPARDQPCP